MFAQEILTNSFLLKAIWLVSWFGEQDTSYNDWTASLVELFKLEVKTRHFILKGNVDLGKFITLF